MKSAEDELSSMTSTVSRNEDDAGDFTDCSDTTSNNSKTHTEIDDPSTFHPTTGTPNSTLKSYSKSGSSTVITPSTPPMATSSKLLVQVNIYKDQLQCKTRYLPTLYPTLYPSFHYSTFIHIYTLIHVPSTH